MIGKTIRSAFLLFALSALWLPGKLTAQELSTAAGAAVSAFEEGNYALALDRFRVLPNEERTQPMASYYRGRCLLELNRDLDDAIELLYGASRNQGVPVDVNFFLGLAYQRSYVFAEAIRYFSYYEDAASRQEIKSSGVRHLVASCRSALEICSTYNQYEVMTVAFLDMSDSAIYSQIRMKGGRLQRKDVSFFSQGEPEEGLNSIMFVPARPVRGDFMFYAGGRADGKDGFQLYRVRRGSTKWGEPEAVKDLNTQGNELLPYFDPIEDDLYFACDGRLGVGAYDLYKSHYDRNRDSWSEAINLGFPLNSASDEFLLLPGADLGMMMVFTNRQGTDSTLTVYRLHLAEPKKAADTGNSELLKEIASLGGVALELLAEMEGEEVLSEPDPSPSVDTDSDQDLDPDAGPSAQDILAEALMYQAASDSLKDLAMLARRRVRESDDPNDRWVWQNQILAWERLSLVEEEQADTLYAMLHMTRSGTKGKYAVNPPEPAASSVAGSVAPAGIEGEPGTPPPASQDGPARGYIMRFDILQSSPYGPSHPIPVDVPLPDGVFYRIQLGAFGVDTDPGTFKGLSPLTAESLPGRELVKYYVGKFSRYSDAALSLEKVRTLEYEDAFIVAWYDGNPVSTQRAKQLE